MGAIRRGRILALSLVSSTLILALGLVALRSDYNQRLTPQRALANPRPYLPPLAAPRLSGKHSPNAVPVFDPVLSYATYLDGSNGISNAYAFLVDTNGNSYVGGSTGASNFPTTTGVINPTDPAPVTYPGQQAAGYVSKLAPDGKSLVFSTYVQGISAVNALALDSAGNIFIAGPTACAPQGPCTPNQPLQIPNGISPYQPSTKGIGILKLNSTATSILAATYLGGSSQDTVGGIAVDSDGSLYIAGTTTSNDFPLLNPIKGSLGAAGQNGFVTKLNSTLTTLGYSTYIDDGEDDYQIATAIAVDSSKDAFVVGAHNFRPLLLDPLTGQAFVTKLNPTGSALLYSVEPAGLGAVNTVAVDAQQNAWIGTLVNPPSPTEQQISANVGTCSTIQPIAAAVRLDNSGSLSFVACLAITEGSDPGVTALSLDAAGNVYTAGFAYDYVFTNAIDATLGYSAFVAAFQPSSSKLIFSSNIDGPSPPVGIGVDSSGNIYVGGTASVGDVAGQGLSNIPTLNALQPTPGSVPCDSTSCQPASAFLLKISPTDAPATAVSPGIVSFSPAAVGTPVGQSLTITNLGSSPLTVSSITTTGADVSVGLINGNSCVTTMAASGGTCTFGVEFSPTSAGTETGTVVITDNSAGSPHIIQVVGVGGQGTAQFSPTSLTFAGQSVGTVSTAQTVTLTNTGNLPLESIHIQASTQFDETNNCASSLAVSASCTINVTFNPTAAVTATGTLTFTDSAVDSPQTVALTGAGQTSTTPPPAPPAIGLGVPSGGSAAATVAAGTSAIYTLSIGGAGMSGAASLTCSGAPTGAVCSVPANVTLSATNPSTVKVSVTTTSRSSASFQPTSLTLWLIALLGLVLAHLAIPRSDRDRRASRLSWRFAPALVIALCACGGGNSSSSPTQSSNSNGTPAGTYTIVVTASSGTITQAQNLTLTVR